MLEGKSKLLVLPSRARLLHLRELRPRAGPSPSVHDVVPQTEKTRAWNSKTPLDAVDDATMHIRLFSDFTKGD